MNVRSRVATCWITCLAFGPSVLLAQGSRFDCSRAAQDGLGGFVGQWQVETLFRAGNSAWDSTAAVATIRSELSGCLLREEYRGERSGEPYSYVALWGANGLGDTPYQRAFAHSQHGLLVLRSGDFVGDTLVLRSITEVRGQEVLEEDRITRPTLASFELVNRRSADGGGTWVVTRRSLYSRVGASESRRAQRNHVDSHIGDAQRRRTFSTIGTRAAQDPSSRGMAVSRSPQDIAR